MNLPVAFASSVTAMNVPFPSFFRPRIAVLGEKKCQNATSISADINHPGPSKVP